MVFLLVMALKNTALMVSLIQSDIQSESKETHDIVVTCIYGSTRVISVPCQDFGGAAPPSFVGEYYFCAIGDKPEFTSDGENFLLFCKDVGEPTTADLELRLCTSTKINEMVGFDIKSISTFNE